MFVTDTRAGKNMGELTVNFFRDVMSATSMIEVSSLIDKRMLIEIEANANCRNAVW